MAKGEKTGGRTAGTPNKRSKMVLEAIDRASQLEAEGDLDGLTLVFRNMIRAGKGLLVQETEGGPVFRQAPDAAAGKVALGYGWGKPVTHVDLTVNDPVEGDGDPAELRDKTIAVIPAFIKKKVVVKKK